MSRHPDPGFDPRIADWLEADPNLAPPDVMRTVENAIPSIPQRRVLRLPWRSLPMNRTILVLATVSLLAVLGIGVVTVGSRPQAPDTTPVPSAPAAVEASPATSPAVTGAAYAAARDEVCTAAVAAADPIEARLGPLYVSGSTDAQRADAIAALRSFVALADGFVADLAALEAPPELAAEHAANVARYDDIVILLRESLALHDEGRTAEALAIDKATDGIAREITRFEQQHALTACP